MSLFRSNVAKVLVACSVLLLSLTALQSEVPETFRNPIISGFHPDPSICRVGEDYYMVNSSFEWFPCLPIFHSKDLVNWKLIGYGIDRPGQADLPEGLPDSRGMYAPTLRYHNGLFYLICTNVRAGGNFYVTAEDPAGPWSDAVWLGSQGIDPSLYWEDGKCYYQGHANITGVADWPNKNGAWMQELDLEQGKLVGERVQLTHGHATNARWTEGPHLYKINGKYMLLVAEGGTGYHHGVTIHHSDELWGPYVPDHVNPVMSHRQLGGEYPIHSVGHADLVQTQNGEWWSVMLGKRLKNGHTFLARETFLTPVVFEELEPGYLTPIFNPGEGKLLFEQKRPDLPWSPFHKESMMDSFFKPELDLKWNFLRTPMSKWYELIDGSLILDLRPEVASEFENPSLIARRIQHHNFESKTRLVFSTEKENEHAGMILYRRSEHYFLLAKEKSSVVLYRASAGKPEAIASAPYEAGKVIFWARTEGGQIQFQYGEEWDEMKPIGEPQDVAVLSDEAAGGFNGPYIGMYASSNGEESGSKASFDWFTYLGLEKQ